MRLRELRVGSLVKYKDRLCNIENINGNNGMLYMRYSDGYYCGAHVDKVEPVEIDKLTLEDSGFENSVPGRYTLITEEAKYHVYIAGDVKNPYYNVEITQLTGNKYIEMNGIKYWHQLQLITGMYED